MKLIEASKLTKEQGDLLKKYSNPNTSIVDGDFVLELSDGTKHERVWTFDATKRIIDLIAP